MSRVVNTNSPGKRRNQGMRAGAELLRHLSQKTEVDDESRDMLAALYYALREIDASIDEAVEAWEKRDYWVKAEQFRQKWTWSGLYKDTLLDILKKQDWTRLPTLFTDLFPHFAEVKINKLTFRPDLWRDRYKALQKEW